MVARRLLLLAAVLLLLAAVATSVAPESETGEDPVLPSAASGPTELVEDTLAADAAEQNIRARVGDLIRFEVTGDVLDAVEIERLDRIDAIAPGTPARFEVLAETSGVYPIRLIEADRRIGRLDIRP